MSQPPTDQPTNMTSDQPDVPTFYVSLRVTLSHDQWDDIKEKVLVGVKYVAFPHRGYGGDNPHFHIFVPSPDKKDAERLRNRFKRGFPDLAGNAYFSCKFQGNGILNAITYGSKEETTAIVSGSDMQDLVLMAPAWVHQERTIGAYMKKAPGKEINSDHFKQITPRNIEKVTLRYRQSNGIKSDQLEDTLEAMSRDNWRLCEHFWKNGILEVYYDAFTAACHGEHHYTAGKYLFLKRKIFDHKSGL